MPDMKTALSKVINEWEKEEKTMSTPQPTTTITVGVSQATYQYVKDHPGTTKAKAIEALDDKGFKPTSTTTLLSSMIRSGQIVVDSHGGMRVTLDRYTPIKTQAKAVPKEKPKAKPIPALREAMQGIAALGVQATPAPTLETRGTKLTAKQVLETLNVQEAYELYKELDKMFN